MVVAGLADRRCPVPGNLLDSRICPPGQIINQSYTLPRIPCPCPYSDIQDKSSSNHTLYPSMTCPYSDTK